MATVIFVNQHIAADSQRHPTVAARILGVVLLLLIAGVAGAQPRSASYFPDAEWKHMEPAEAGIDPQHLKDAIEFAIASESKNPRNLTLNHYRTFGREPFGHAI